MIFSKFKKKLPFYFVTGLLVFAVVLVIGFLSFTGMLSIYASIGFAIGAFLLAGLVEGEVYAQNISRALEKLFGKQELALAICHQHLQRLAKENPENAFLKEYAKLEAAIHKLEEKKAHAAHKHKRSLEDLKKAAKREEKLEKKRKTLRWMQQYFKAWVEGEVKNDSNLALIEDKREAILTEITWKTRFSWFCLGVSVVAGIGYGLVFLHAAPESIAACINYFHLILPPSWTLGITIGIYVFAAVASAGYMLLIYNNLTDMVTAYDGSESLLEKIKDFFSRKETPLGKESIPAYVLRVGFWVLLSIIIIGLATYATVTTGATWWNEAQEGIVFIVPYLGSAAVWICGITVAVMGVTALQFNLLNSFRAIAALGRGSPAAIERAWDKIEKSVEKTFDKEGVLQFLNPFRLLIILISIPFKILVFLGHIVSTGLIGEESNLLPERLKGLTTALNSLVDAMVDGFFLFSEDEHEDDHGGHNHSHAGIPELFLQIILLPLTCLSAVWIFVTQFCRCESDKKPMSFVEACSSAGVPRFFLQPFLPEKGENDKKKPIQSGHSQDQQSCPSLLHPSSIPACTGTSLGRGEPKQLSKVFTAVLDYKVNEKSTRKAFESEAKSALEQRYRSIIMA
jgi:hypothetical protein